jgi:hypothetical protein
MIAGPGTGQVDRAAEVIGVSSPTLYRWLRAGNMRGARGFEVLRVHELTRLPLESLLGGSTRRSLKRPSTSNRQPRAQR